MSYVVRAEYSFLLFPFSCEMGLREALCEQMLRWFRWRPPCGRGCIQSLASEFPGAPSWRSCTSMHGHGKNGIVELIFSDMITVADTDHLPLPLKATMSDLLTFTCRRREQTLLANKRAFYCVFVRSSCGPFAHRRSHHDASSQNDAARPTLRGSERERTWVGLSKRHLG